jgi:hypothetical protein
MRDRLIRLVAQVMQPCHHVPQLGERVDPEMAAGADDRVVDHRPTAGVDEPQEIVDYLKSKFGQEINKQTASSYKSVIKSKDGSGAARGPGGRWRGRGGSGAGGEGAGGGPRGGRGEGDGRRVRRVTEL